MTDLKHLQNVILLIAKDIDQICRKHGIEYYLLGGSCIGAIRHNGFIPWDDDLDIIMTSDNYYKFLSVAKKELSSEKYYIQEGLKDWPLDFSKVRLKGTIFEEDDDTDVSSDKSGIFVDVFRLDNISDSNFKARVHYILYKYYLCYQLSERSYKNATFKKKLMMFMAAPLKIRFIRNLLIKWLKKQDAYTTNRLAFLCGRTRFKTAITQKTIYGKPTYVKFEDTYLPVPEKYHQYLTQMFGDYMTLPPEEQRHSQHLKSINFGAY